MHDAWRGALMSYHSEMRESDVGQTGADTPLFLSTNNFLGETWAPGRVGMW